MVHMLHQIYDIFRLTPFLIFALTGIAKSSKSWPLIRLLVLLSSNLMKPRSFDCLSHTKRTVRIPKQRRVHLWRLKPNKGLGQYVVPWIGMSILNVTMFKVLSGKKRRDVKSIQNQELLVRNCGAKYL